MSLQYCAENFSNPSHFDEESYPQGYLEALENCSALAVNLLEKAINNVDVKRCWDCDSWVGRCLNGEVNKVARDQACDRFTQKLEAPSVDR